MARTEQFRCFPEPGDVATGNVVPLLHEIRHALQRWLDQGVTATIDLRSIPMGPGEEQRIVEELGRGEVAAKLSALGTSEVLETRFPGVWLVTHYNSDDETIGRTVEVTDMPDILKSQREDVRECALRLAAYVNSLP